MPKKKRAIADVPIHHATDDGTPLFVEQGAEIPSDEHWPAELVDELVATGGAHWDGE